MLISVQMGFMFFSVFFLADFYLLFYHAGFINLIYLISVNDQTPFHFPILLFEVISTIIYVPILHNSYTLLIYIYNVI